MKSASIILILLLNLININLFSATAYQAKNLRSQGDLALTKREYTKALNYYKKALKINPYYKEAKIGVGKAFFELGNYEEAGYYFKNVEKQFANDPEIKLCLARLQFKKEEFDSSESYLRKVLELDSKNYDALILYGDIYFKKKRYNEALQYYQEANSINPKNELALLKLGRGYLQKRDTKKALAYFEDAEAINNLSHLTQYYLGEYYFREKDYVLANQHLSTSLLIKDNYQPSMILMYQVFFELNKWDQAKDILNKLLALNPQNKNYYYHLGFAYEQLNMEDKSISTLLKGMQLDFGDEALRFLAENVYHKYYWNNKKVRQRGSKLATYWYNKGKNYLKQNLSDYAIFAFRRGIRLNPNHWPMRLKLANIYKKRGLINLYYNELKVIQSIQPDNSSIQDEIRFTERAMKRLLSRQENIEQYSEPKTMPKIALSHFTKNNDYDHHFDVQKIFRDSFYTALKMKHKLNVYYIEKNTVDEIELAKKENCDFLITGEIQEEGDIIKVKIHINNLRDGESYKILKVNQRGNDRFISASMQLARQVEKLFPIFGKIIRKNYKEVYLNIGKRHGYKKNDRFYVIKSKTALSNLLSKKDLDLIIKSNDLLTRTLLSFLSDKKMGLEEIVLTDLDENISKGRIVTSDFFNEVNINNYVIHKPE